MTQLFKIIKDLQPLIIGLLIIWAVVQWNTTDDFIQEREESYKLFKDSIIEANGALLMDNVHKDAKIDSLMQHNDSIDARIHTLDSSLNALKGILDEEFDDIDNTDVDGNIGIFTRNLSQESTD